jgi:hypothetical protein
LYDEDEEKIQKHVLVEMLEMNNKMMMMMMMELVYHYHEKMV